MVKFLNYLKRMNKKLVNYKYGDDLSRYITINNYILKNYNRNMSGGNYTFDATKKLCIDLPTGAYSTKDLCEKAQQSNINVLQTKTNESEHVTNILLKAFQELTDEMLEQINKTYNSNDPTDSRDYKKISKYLLYNIEVLSQYFPDEYLIELSKQIISINEIVKQKLKEVENLSS
jgi:hypothetical protein